MGNPEFLHSLKSLTVRHRGCVATIGSFDGVHRGHKVVLQQVKDKAKSLGLPSLVMVFEPQPYEFFSRESAPARLMRLREKVCALFSEGVDRVLCLKFDESLRSLTAQAYIDQVLINGLGVKHLVIGDDFRFGCDRSGDFNMLCEAGKLNGFSVCDTQTQSDDGDRISSTRIRKLLEQDQLGDAQRLLGKDYSVYGRVIYGKQLGRKIGFPTLNIGLGRYRAPVQGVYAVEVRQDGSASKKCWQGVANVGVRPTVEGNAKPLLEVHLLNENQNLYGEFLTVVFKKKIRKEQKFADVDELKLQIKRDSDAARTFFADAK
ncbi:MAG: bifunctional riboflavin kinase/FAD synthetase [Agarilytica sp.]